jgi:hypothetical protein
MKSGIKKKVSPHSYAHLLGFLYPIRFNEADADPSAFVSLTKNLLTEFGQPCRQLHFVKGYGTTRAAPGTAWLNSKELRWFAGPVNWNSRSIWSPGNRHMVFRTEQDRTWARILIGK